MHTGVGGGAQFTRVAPGSSQGTATGRSGHAHTDLGAAGNSTVATCEYVQEAVADADIWNGFIITHQHTESSPLCNRIVYVTEEHFPMFLTHTAHSSGIELKVSWAVTQVTPWGVHTQPVDAVHRVSTFIDVCSTQ